MFKALGIDLGMRPKTAMALVTVDGEKFHLEGEVQIGVTDRDIIKAAWTLEPDIICFDAPLTGEMGRQREADLCLRELFRAFSDTLSAEGSIGSPFGRMLFPITYRGFYLRDQLKDYFRLLETHPFANFLFLDNKKSPTKVWRCRKVDNTCQHELLKRYVDNLPDGLTDDQYDAVMCGVTGCVEMAGHVFISLQNLNQNGDSSPPFKIFNLIP